MLSSIDATFDDGKCGRPINHGKKSPNLRPVITTTDGIPHLFFTAQRNIEAGEELLYDYGERDTTVIQSNPWLNS